MVQWINPKLIRANTQNPREKIETEDLENSMKSEGFKEKYPIVVRPIKDDRHKFEVIEGDRRLHAAIKAGIPEVAYISENLNDKQAFLESIKENVLRQSFKPVEEAKAFLKLQKEYGMSNVVIARSICKTEAYVRNRLDLLKLDMDVQELLDKIPIKHAEYISEVSDKDVQKMLANRTINQNISQKEFKRVVDRVKKVDADKAKKIIGPAFADKFKKTELYKKAKGEKKDKRLELKSYVTDFEKYISDMASWSSMLSASMMEASVNIPVDDLLEIYKLSDDKKMIRKYVHDILKNKERIDKFCSSEFYEKLEKI